MLNIGQNNNNNYHLRATFGLRLAAFLLDYFVIGIIAILFFSIGFGSLFTGLMLSQKYSENGFIFGAITGGMIGALITLAVLFYLIVLLYGLIEAFTGASPGKRIVGLKIAREDGVEGDTSLYLKRWGFKNLGYVLNMIPFISFFGSIYNFLIIIGCFFVLGEKRQAFHDMIVKTAVFRKQDIILLDTTN